MYWNFKYICSYDECSSGFGDPTQTLEYDLNGTSGNNAECGHSKSCGYFETTCDTDNALLAYFPIGNCYSLSNQVAYIYQCNDTVLTTSLYSNPNCNGTAVSQDIDYGFLYTDECHQVK